MVRDKLLCAFLKDLIDEMWDLLNSSYAISDALSSDVRIAFWEAGGGAAWTPQAQTEPDVCPSGWLDSAGGSLVKLILGLNVLRVRAPENRKLLCSNLAAVWPGSPRAE